ncbi:hypothetical protein [Bradyrhizobium sp. BR13661]|jgi:hypothetical protein|uniref:hypothetical protein n=1 Tax=Bradyrhizobium sp. BR13661 TaxID=2940622 RepID=UPI002475C3CC|nr:hypothetical protein [Bradyrhizobium sp. BR13661]MDH6257506.1 hypothetical protein [Bradyrhizobium sp. BR13661]
MNSQEKTVTTVDELIAATKDKAAHHVVLRGGLTNAPSIRLAPGQSLRGDGDAAAITFAAGTDGLQLSSDNRLHNIRLDATVNKRAIFNDTSVESLGRIELRSVTTTGCVQILARDKVRGMSTSTASTSSPPTPAARKNARTVTASMSSTAPSRCGTCSRTPA